MKSLTVKTRSREEPNERKKIVAFLASSAGLPQRSVRASRILTATTGRKKLVGNTLTEEAVVWSSLSIIVLLAELAWRSCWNSSSEWTPTK